eukprot:scaffold18570_cov89-Cylindrotheca_fusiformis.AAC.1
MMKEILKMKTSLFLASLILLTTSQKATALTDFISCSDTCNGGDVNYHLVASVETVKMMNYTYRGRIYKTENGGVDEDTRFMGPTMHVTPGQSMWIKFTNNMTATDIETGGPSAYDYWIRLKNPGESIKYEYYKRLDESPDLLEADDPNIPKHFESTNLHVHGLDVEVHMFDPVGTHHPDAPHIKIDPGECYCCRFNIPEHHPPGMYWYHPHLHGSTAIQMWGGMMGVLYVDGPLEKELANYGVTQTEEFIIWDPAFQAVDKPTHNLEVDEFLNRLTTVSKVHPFLVNGKINPSFETSVGQVLHLRVLCAIAENEVTFIVYPEGRENEPWDDAALDFWVIGADGVSYKRPAKKHIVVMSGGQRFEILLKFDEPGTYVISQQGIKGIQFFDMYGHPHDEILATIQVKEDTSAQKPTIAIEGMVFTPGYDESESIVADDIVKSESIVFSMGADRNKIPFPQYYVNGQAFHPNRLDFFAEPGEAREYLLINANHNVHSFHIHANRFQVKEVGSELSMEEYPVLKAMMDYEPNGWRDTVVVPPNGRALIWVQYKNHTGKTVFHCNFLAHEDTGMMSTLFIGDPDFTLSRWKNENIDFVVGVCIGLAVIVFGLALFILNTKKKHDYELVSSTTNEMNSKEAD